MTAERLTPFGCRPAGRFDDRWGIDAVLDLRCDDGPPGARRGRIVVRAGRVAVHADDGEPAASVASVASVASPTLSVALPWTAAVRWLGDPEVLFGDVAGSLVDLGGRVAWISAFDGLRWLADLSPGPAAVDATLAWGGARLAGLGGPRPTWTPYGSRAGDREDR